MPSPWSIGTRYQLWRLYSALGIALVAVYLFSSGRIGDVLQSAIYLVMAPLAVAAILFGMRRYRPADPIAWWMLAGSMASFWIGTVVWSYYENILLRDPPFPSVADIAYLIGYPLTGVALIRFGRARLSERGSLLDAAVIGTSFGVFSWFAFLEPVLRDPSSPVLTRLVGAASPAMDVLLLSGIALLILSPGGRSPAFLLLAMSAGLTFLSDLAYAQAAVTGAYVSGGLIDSGWLLSYVFLGASALHPSMATIARREQSAPQSLTVRRLALQTLAMSATPLLILFDNGHEFGDVVVLIFAVVVLIVLNLLRLTGLVRSAAESAVTLRKAEAKYRRLVEQMPAVIYVDSRDKHGVAGPTTYVSPRIQTLLGYSPEEWLADPSMWARHIHPADAERITSLTHRAIGETPTVLAEYRMLTRDGRVIWVHDEAAPLPDEAELPNAWQGVVMDITAAKEAEVAREQSELHYRELFDEAPGMYVITRHVDGQTLIVDCNKLFIETLGYAREEILDRPLSDFYAPSMSANLLDGGHMSVQAEAINDLERELVARDGRIIVTLARIQPELDSDKRVTGTRTMFVDVTARKALESQIAHQALHDPLTDLPNRALFADRAAHAVARSARGLTGVAVIMIDLDNFKRVNDSLGHRAGDDLLIEVAQRLLSSLRAGDTVARLGGDEFIVLLEDVVDEHEALAAAERILDRLHFPCSIEGTEIIVAPSIGVAVSFAGREAADVLVSQADIAMYEAKRTGKARYVVFDPHLGNRAWTLLQRESELRRGLAQGELQVYYQPLVDLETEHLIGVEALVRWQHPERGLVPPQEFIPVAEETGLIVPLGRQVLREACRQVSIWQKEREPATPPLEVAVNLSARQFQDRGLLKDVAQILSECDLVPGTLRLEITESVATEDLESSVPTMDALRELGVQLAIDDFGTGYSGLSSLKRCPVDTIKIDRAFVEGLGSDAEDTAIVKAVITLARTLGLNVTAEGIETNLHVEELRRLGCDSGQGFYYDKPLPADQIEAHYGLSQVIAGAA